MPEDGYLSAAETAERLGITLPTLYSYVSRGLIRSEVADAGRRTRRYRLEDVQQLQERQKLRHDPQQAVETALHWGVPVLESALTLIDSGRYYYRGQDALTLATTASVEQVAGLLWTGDATKSEDLFRGEFPYFSERCLAVSRLLEAAPPMERFQTLLPLLGSEDLAAYDLRPAPVAQTGARLLRRMACLAVHPTEPQPEAGIAETLQRFWLPERPQAAPALRSALILCADHELNVSSFTARCVASAAASPYAVVSAGLAALTGTKHGGMSERVEALFREAGEAKYAETTLGQRLRRGETVPGFGHRLYPAGDPRARLLLHLAAESAPASPTLALSTALAEAGRSLLGEAPNLDFGLVTLCATLDLPRGAALCLFALGRTIGWIAHAIEEYRNDSLIRPRAYYRGPSPITSQESTSFHTEEM